MLYTQDQVFEEGLLDIDGIVEYKPDLATIQDIRRVHFCVPDEWSVVTESHLISAGGAKTIGIQVMDRNVERGFALVRPPGHHAMRVVHGARGFCNVNIEAIMIEYLREAYGIDRVAIVDTDCHHGDGTQDIYWHDPDTLFISLHQDGRTLYPGSGFENEIGGPTALGATVNVPLPPRTSEEGFLYVLEQVVLPILEEFKPDLVVNSAGQDNHYTDPITNMCFSAQGYAELTRRLKPDIAVLEGGYSIETALPYVNVGIIMAMAGLDCAGVREPDYVPGKHRQSRDLTRHIEQVVQTVHDRRSRIPEYRARIMGGQEYAERRLQIYYDTDNISEDRREKLRVCPECAGVLGIDSRADNGYHIYAVHIPRKACGSCQELGYRWFDSADPKVFTHVFLQDRTHDQYIIRKV